MIKYIDADEWELSFLTIASINELREKNRPVCLLTEFVHEREKVVLMNMFAPKNCLFWNFSNRYSAFSFGLGELQKYLIFRPAWKDYLVELNQLCNPDDNTLFSFFLMGGLTARFEEFLGKNLNDVWSMLYFHCSVAATADVVEGVKKYFELQLEYFEDDAFAYDDGKDFSDESKKKYEKLFVSRLSNANAIELDNDRQLMREYQINKSAFLYANMLPPDFYPPWEHSGVSLEVMSNVFKERAKWLVSNLSVLRITEAKNYISKGSRFWGRPDYARLRNELMQIFDLKLANFPIIQTNPYEYKTYKYPLR